MLIHSGTQERLLKESTTGAGSSSKEGSIASDSLLVTLFADTVASGNLSVSVYTLTSGGREVEIISFPTITAPTTQLLLRKAAVSMQRFRVVATYTGSCSYEVYVRAIEGAGEASVRIIGAAELSTSQITATTTPAVLLASALTDRQGVTLKNFSGTGTLYVSEDQAKLPGQAWPITPGETWSLDVAAGVTIYGVSSAGSIDVRIAESGG